MKKPARSKFVAIFAFLAMALFVSWRMRLLETTPRAPQAGAARTQPSASAQAAVRDLSWDERQGGHTLSRHVGRSERELALRLEREAGVAAASSFTDRSTAESVVGATLEREQQRVAVWMRHNKDNLALDYRGEAGRPIGFVLRRGQSRASPASDARVVLRKRGDQFFVLTAYPEMP